MAERAGGDALRLRQRPEPGPLVESLMPGSYRAGAGLCRRQR
jgi:hypothetical protein